MNDDLVAIASDGNSMFVIRTKPCWICGQYSRITMPARAYNLMEGSDVHPAVAWPQGTREQHVLLISGTHQKCWDQEFPNKPFQY